MELVLAIDLKGGQVVHGMKGDRMTYRPLRWGPAPSADPVPFIKFLKPRHIYIADLDRIEGVSNHDQVIFQCAEMVERCYVDRGCRSPADYLSANQVVNVVGTETAGQDLSIYHGGYLSIDVKNGVVVPHGSTPGTVLGVLEDLSFEGCIILNIGAVGTHKIPGHTELERWRSQYSGRLLYGGGVSGLEDLTTLHHLGYDGAILSTAVHRGAVPYSLLQEGFLC